VPPNRWFHQHSNIGGAPARYLAIHPPRGRRGISEKIEDRARDPIVNVDEDPMNREKFVSEVARKAADKNRVIWIIANGEWKIE